jgi:hypothetical protein
MSSKSMVVASRWPLAKSKGQIPQFTNCHPLLVFFN